MGGQQGVSEVSVPEMSCLEFLEPEYTEEMLRWQQPDRPNRPHQRLDWRVAGGLPSVSGCMWIFYGADVPCSRFDRFLTCKVTVNTASSRLLAVPDA